MDLNKIRRAQFLTDRSIQSKYIVTVLGFMLAMLVVAVAIIYITGWSQLVERLAGVYPQGRLQGILKVIYLRLLLGFLLLIPLAMFVSVVVSHHVAGPLVRIKRYLRLMARGEFDLAPLELRRYDELKDVALLINQILDNQKVRGQGR
ncbi:MAG: hypothetical protein HY594_01180 [Candidatus Omnitrophica bacterium]|nr:hypothetical protein [Candidatus Omnitrophota bacterium]